MTSISATFSVEDNKLRLYANSRLDDELYQRVKKMGFKWAPKQELFVAPRWTPMREDFCLELAGEIAGEETTMVERAEEKSARLDNLANKRSDQANSFHRAANQISERFSMGQPILVGHHSERKARRDKDRMNHAMSQSVKAAKAVNYWNWKSEGVERHANRKANPAVRKRRMKTLLVELRDHQRDINHAFICLDLWENIKKDVNNSKFDSLVKHYAGAELKTGSAAPYLEGESFWSMLNDEKISSMEVVDRCIVFSKKQSSSMYSSRWISHILNRLAYERSELGEVMRFDGELTAAVLQTFARMHGAHKPKAKKHGNNWELISTAPLPAHLADGKTLILSVTDWRELMFASGYEVPATKPKKPSILNFEALHLKSNNLYHAHEVVVYRQIKLTKAEYAKIHVDYRGVRLSMCKEFRFKICKNPEQIGYDAEYCAVFLTDSKEHDSPESSSIVFKKTESEAA